MGSKVMENNENISFLDENDNILKMDGKTDIEELDEKPFDTIDPRDGIPIGLTFNQLLKSKMALTKFEQSKQLQEEKLRNQRHTTFFQAKSLINQKKYDEAIEILRTLIQMFPKEADYHSYIGLAMLGKGWSGYAMAEFKVALHYAPDNKIALEKYIPNSVFTPKKADHPEPKVKNEEKKSLLSKLFGRAK